MEYEEILKRKIEHYGETKAAYQFAAEEYATHKKLWFAINELEWIAVRMANGNPAKDRVLNRIKELKLQLAK